MPVTNSGRKAKRRQSNEPKSPKKKARRSFNQSSTSNEAERTLDLTSPPSSYSTPLTLRLKKIKNTDLFEISSQEPADLLEISSQEPAEMAANNEAKSPEMSQKDFQRLVLAKLCGLEAGMDKRFNLIETKAEIHSEDIEELKVTALEQLIKIQTLEDEVQKLKDQPQTTTEKTTKNRVVIKNLVKQDWTAPKKLEESNKLIHFLLPGTKDVIKCEEIKTTGILIITLNQDHTIEEIMKTKKALKDTEEYSNIYIEEELTRDEQRYRASMRAVAKVTKGVIFRGGQLREDKEPPTKRIKRVPVRNYQPKQVAMDVTAEEETKNRNKEPAATEQERKDPDQTKKSE